MPSVSFVKNETVPTPVAGVTVESITTAVPEGAVNVTPTATPQPAPAPACESVAVGGNSQGAASSSSSIARRNSLVLGDTVPSFDQVILPRLNIAQNLGELGQSFTPGSIVYNQTTLLFAPAETEVKTKAVTKPATPPVIIVCLGFRPTRYAEHVVGGGKGMLVKTEDEVRANGGTLDWNEWNLKKASGMKKFDILAEALFAIERPEGIADDDTVFVYPVVGKKWALAIYSMKSTAYTAAAKGCFFTNRAAGCLREGYPTRQFAFSTRWKDFPNGNGAHIPVLVAGPKTTPEFLAWVADVLNPGEAAPTGE